MIVERINSPDDVKKLSIEECNILSDEIRQLLIQKISKRGGHLGSNLGVVELTVAVHYIFDAPKDKIIFDVSHQCYTHKILTGRKDAFLYPEHYGDVNGYTNSDESEYDLFKVGHTSTSVSLACGYAKARDLMGGNEKVIAIIGDGSLSGGEAFEGLDYGGSDIDGGIIVIFNDNQMSIADNHGGLYKSLEDLRNTDGKSGNNYFKSLGYEYIFVKNGNDISDLIYNLKKAKEKSGSIVVHVCTTKGKGYLFAENNKESCHWKKPFDIETGEDVNNFNGERYDRIVRDHLIEKMNLDKKVVTMIAAVPDSLNFSKEYREKAGKQFIDVGIAEEHAISMAAGLAKAGCKPVFATLSTFYQRTYDQISQELCINNAAATLLVINASVYAVNDVTHIGIFDISMMSNIPNLVYLAPTNKQEYLAMIDWSIEQNDYPVAIRAPRNGVYYSDSVVDTDYSNLNTYKMVKKGEQIAVIALGDFYQLGESVVDKIKESMGIDASLINPRYITGIDKLMLDNLKINHELIVTLEDGIVEGGWGPKISSYLGDSNIKIINYGLKKEFIDGYDLQEVLNYNHLRDDMIVDDINSLLNR